MVFLRTGLILRYILQCCWCLPTDIFALLPLGFFLQDLDLSSGSPSLILSICVFLFIPGMLYDIVLSLYFHQHFKLLLISRILSKLIWVPEFSQFNLTVHFVIDIMLNIWNSITFNKIVVAYLTIKFIFISIIFIKILWFEVIHSGYLDIMCSTITPTISVHLTPAMFPGSLPPWANPVKMLNYCLEA